MGSNGVYSSNSKVPIEIKALITKEFLILFRDEMQKVTGASLCSYTEEWSRHHISAWWECTYGWYHSFYHACDQLGKPKLKEYVESLSFGKREFFAEGLSDMLVEHRLILGGYKEDYLIAELDLDEKAILGCDRCGKFFFEKNLEWRISERRYPRPNEVIEQVTWVSWDSDEVDTDDDNVELVCMLCSYDERGEDIKMRERIWFS